MAASAATRRCESWLHRESIIPLLAISLRIDSLETIHTENCCNRRWLPFENSLKTMAAALCCVRPHSPRLVSRTISGSASITSRKLCPIRRIFLNSSSESESGTSVRSQMTTSPKNSPNTHSSSASSTHEPTPPISSTVSVPLARPEPTATLLVF